MIDPALSDILRVHILAGGVALVAGFVALVTKKGGRRHVTAGRSYVISMGVVVVTALPLAVAIGSWFLLAIAVFSGYLVFAGARAISGRRSGTEKAELVDVIGHGAMALCGIGMAAGGVWYWSVGPPAPTLVVFGGIGVGLAVGELRTLGEPPSDGDPWLARHIGFMGGAYIATVTAAITVNLPVLPPLARWLAPTLIGVPCIVVATRRHASPSRSR